MYFEYSTMENDNHRSDEVTTESHGKHSGVESGV